MILSSHLLNLVEELCTKLLVLRQGRAVAYGTIGEIIEAHPSLVSKSLEEVFLSLTATRFVGRMNALLYLSWNSARNRFLSAFRRARSPRYAVALIVGGLYLWGFLWRPVNYPGATSFLLSQPSEMLITLLAVLTLAGPWVFGSDTLALAFTQAEVSMLFPAPISRRGLIGHKLFRAQVAVLINAAIWVFVLRRGGNFLPSPLRAVGVWVLFSTLNLHRLGAALVQSSLKEHGRAAAKRNWWSIALFGFVGAALVSGFVVNRRELLDTTGIGEFFVAVAHVLAQPPASIGLWPFHLVVAPTFARSIAQWRYAIIPALAVMGLHVLWVLRNDAAFEDAALEASEERARRVDAIRSRRLARRAEVASLAAEDDAAPRRDGPSGDGDLLEEHLVPAAHGAASPADRSGGNGDRVRRGAVERRRATSRYGSPRRRRRSRGHADRVRRAYRCETTCDTTCCICRCSRPCRSARATSCSPRSRRRPCRSAALQMAVIVNRVRRQLLGRSESAFSEPCGSPSWRRAVPHARDQRRAHHDSERNGDALSGVDSPRRRR